MAKMKEVIMAGVWRVSEIQLLIRDFVCNELFAGQPEPSRFDSRFWPSDKTIRNCRCRFRYLAKVNQVKYVVLLSSVCFYSKPF